MKLQTLKDLYVHELKALYSAEEQILKALPKMIQATANAQLTAAFQAHLEQTQNSRSPVVAGWGSRNENETNLAVLRLLLWSGRT